MIEIDRGIKSVVLGDVTVAYIQTPSGFLLKVKDPDGHQWRGISGLFPDVPSMVTWTNSKTVKVSFTSWASREAEVSPPSSVSKKKKKYEREDNRGSIGMIRISSRLKFAPTKKCLS